MRITAVKQPGSLWLDHLWLFVARAFHSLWTGSGPAIPGVIGFGEDGALSESGSGTEGAGIGLTILGVTRVGLGLGLGSFGRGRGRADCSRSNCLKARS